MRSILVALVLTGVASSLAAQGTIKFDFNGRYDSVLTGSDTAFLKMTIIEFHRKLALAGYASYYKNDPRILAKYVDVLPESITMVSESIRMTTLQEIASEIEMSRDPAVFDRIELHRIFFQTDTLAEVNAVTPFLAPVTDESTSTDVKYVLHRVPKTSHWWVYSTNSAEGEIRYRYYLGLPDEAAYEEEKR